VKRNEKLKELGALLKPGFFFFFHGISSDFQNQKRKNPTFGQICPGFENLEEL